MKLNHDNFKVGRIMIVDDEAELMTALCEAIAEQGYETNGFTSGADALKILVEQDYDLLLTDLMMPQMDGIALLQAGLEIDPNLVCIIMTGHGTVQTAVDAMKKGAFDYILKPFKLNTLMPVLSRAMEVRSLRMDNIQLKETVAIHELGKAIAFSTDLNAILNKVADATLQQYNADEVSIMLPTRGDKELYVAVARGGHSDYIGEHVPMERGIAGWVARNRETVIMNGKVEDPRFSPVNPRSDIRAAISMPMMAGGKLVGVLNVNVTKSHRRITIGQVKALSILVSIISPILENSWLNIRMRQAEEKYRSIFENSTEGIFQSTPEGQFLIANRAFAEMLGYDSPDELISTVTDIARQIYVNPEEREKLFQVIKDRGMAKSFETRFYRKDGRMIWVSISMRAVSDEKGNFLYYEGLEEDISERKLAESQRALTSRILEMLNRPNAIINMIRDILLLLKEHTGIEAIGIRLREGDDFPYYVTNGFPDHFVEAEKYLCARDNTGGIIRDSQGNPCLECMCGNIVCGRTDPTLPFFTEGGSFWSNSTTELLASTSEEDRQTRTRNRCNSEGYESVALIPLRSGDEIIGLLQLNDSRRDSLMIEMIHFFEEIGATIGIAVTRKRTETALRMSEEKFAKIFQTSPDAILISSATDGRIIEVNLNATVISGFTAEEMIGRTSTELELWADAAALDAYVAQILRDGRVVNFETVFRQKSGGIITGLISGEIIQLQIGKCFLSVIRDITERKKMEADKSILEAQFQQAQKLEAVGLLTGGIAHDFNNLLTIITGYSELAIQEAGKDSPLYEFLVDIKGAGERAAALTRQLLAFSSKQILQPEVANLNEVLGNMDRMLRRVIRESIEIKTILSPDLGQVYIDIGQMEQVLMNLAVNAQDVMPEGGKLTFETSNAELDETYALTHIGVTPGPYVVMAVTDTGIGMTKEVQARIFEPFFTTKEKGKGTGLGLSTVYGIIKQSKGSIWVYSEPGKGSTFKIYLPRVEETVSIVRESAAVAESLQGSETILLVEDEKMVRNIALKILQNYGYTVLCAKDGEEALHIRRQHQEQVQLMLTDVVMPGMSGRELAKRMEELHPEIKVLFMSGYTDKAIVHNGFLDKRIAFIQKPFTPVALARKVREVLNK